jgi:RHS repeat-associated protein
MKAYNSRSIEISNYTVYGYSTPSSYLGFNGEPLDKFSGSYHLGQGHRAYNHSLMRFSSPDRLSPFDRGGVNAYAYCVGDPVNRSDPTGTNAIYRMMKLHQEFKTQRKATLMKQGLDILQQAQQHEPDLFTSITKYLNDDSLLYAGLVVEKHNNRKDLFSWTQRIIYDAKIYHLNRWIENKPARYSTDTLVSQHTIERIRELDKLKNPLEEAKIMLETAREMRDNIV